MKIQELVKHENGILNLYEASKPRQPITHIKGGSEKSSIFDIRLSPAEYDSIFDKPPTFYEKKAFVEVFRKKWKEDKGYCSIFDKRSWYKSSKVGEGKRI